MYLHPVTIHLPDTDFASNIAPLLDKDFDPFDLDLSDMDDAFEDDNASD
jgi:hypothetical protein